MTITKEQAIQHAFTRPWVFCCRGGQKRHRDGYHHKGSGYYFLNLYILQDYIQDIKNPTDKEKSLLRVLGMSDLAWDYWFDYPTWLNKVKKDNSVGFHYYREKIQELHKLIRQGVPW